VTVEAAPGVLYTLKSSPYSSHFLLLDLFPPAGRGLRVLDLGCANGYLAAHIAAAGYRVTGVERPSGVTEEFPSGVRLVHADLEFGLPDLDGCFDRVLCADILEHLRDPLSLLNDVRQIMAPEAKLVASLPNSGNFYFRLNVLLGRFPQHDKGLFDRTHVRFFMWDGWVELFSRAGFQIESVKPTGIPAGLAFPGAPAGMIRLAEALSYWMARLWKRLFAYQFIVVARPTKGHDR
jgi:SAM-dependent methyltransferase